MLGVVSRHEFVASVGIGDVVAGVDDVFAVSAEHFQYILLHAGLDGCDERTGCIVRTAEGLLGLCRRHQPTQAHDCGEARKEANMSRRMKNGHDQLLEPTGMCAPPASQSL